MKEKKMFNCKCIECGKDFEAKTMYKEICGPKCAVKKWRRTDKGKASLVEQLKKAQKRKHRKTCEHCKDKFMTARKARRLCDKCVPEHGLTYAQKRYRGK
jgi:hypothetical protein